jgi:hypothetical protein
VRRGLESAAAVYQAAREDRTVRRTELVPGNPFYAAMNGGR